MRYVGAAAWLAMVVLASGCSKNEKLPYGIDLLDRLDVGGVRAVEISPPEAEATYEHGQVTTGRSPYLLVGQADGYRAAFVIRFAALPDSAVIERATLWLSPASYRGETAQVALLVQQVTAAWDEETITWANFAGGGGPQVGQGSIVTGDSNRIGLSLDPSIVQAWVDSSVANDGLHVSGLGPALVEFHSRQATDTTRLPKLCAQRGGGHDLCCARR